MRKGIVILIVIFTALAAVAIEKLNIYINNGTVKSFNVDKVDSLTFTNNHTSLSVFLDDNTYSEYNISDIDSISFSGVPDSVYIAYSGNSVSVINPLEGAGIDISIVGADVIVNSNIVDNEIRYVLSGTTATGSLKIYSTYKAELILNGLNLTNDNGPAINIQSTKKFTINNSYGKTNSLTDASTYDTSTEDQKACLFSEGQLIFKGTGALTVKSNNNHAICSDDYIEIEEGSITVSGAVKDGIHTKGHFNLEGGTVNISATADAVDCEGGRINISGGTLLSTIATADAKGLKCDSTFVMTNGYVQLSLSGNQTKGIKSGGNMNLSGGEIKISSTGAVVLTASGSGYDPSYCTAIKGDSDVNTAGTKITLTASGAGSKGISANGDINITSGIVSITNSGTGATYKNTSNITDSYNSTCITSDKNISITGGTISATATGTGGKGISANGTVIVGDNTNSPTITLKTTGAKFIVSGSDYCHPKTMKSDGAITINNGIVDISSTDDGIKSENSITINGGSVTIGTSYEGIESKYIYLKGGITNVTATNDGLNTTMGTVSGGTESNDNSLLSISGGTHYVNATSGDAIDSNGNITMTGGTVFANGPQSGVEEAVDFNGSFNMNGGTFVGCGSSSNMTKAMSTTSTQANMYISSRSMISTSTMMTITIGVTAVASFKPKYGGYKFLISTPEMKKGSAYVIYTGGSYTGGSITNNYYSGGTFSTSGATSKKSGTLSATATVNTISF